MPRVPLLVHRFLAMGLLGLVTFGLSSCASSPAGQVTDAFEARQTARIEILPVETPTLHDDLESFSTRSLSGEVLFGGGEIDVLSLLLEEVQPPLRARGYSLSLATEPEGNREVRTIPATVLKIRLTRWARLPVAGWTFVQGRLELELLDPADDVVLYTADVGFDTRSGSGRPGRLTPGALRLELRGALERALGELPALPEVDGASG